MAGMKGKAFFTRKPVTLLEAEDRQKKLLNQMEKRLNSLPKSVNALKDLRAMNGYCQTFRAVLMECYVGKLESSRSAREQLRSDLDNFYAVSCRFVEAYERGSLRDKETEFANCYRYMADCYRYGIGTEKDGQLVDQNVNKYWLAYLSSDLKKAFKAHPPQTAELFAQYADFVGNCIKNSFTRDSYEKFEQLLLDQAADHEKDTLPYYFCLCLLKELYSLQEIGVFAASDTQEAESLMKKAAENHDLYAVFYQKGINFPQAICLKHSTLLLCTKPEEELKSSGEKACYKDQAGRAKAASLRPTALRGRMHQEKADYREPYDRAEAERAEAERQRRLKEEEKKLSGVLYQEGMNLFSAGITDEEIEEGKQKLQKAAQLGSLAAQDALLNIAAEEGDPASQFILGEQYHLGRSGKPKDYSIAFNWFSKAARQQHPIATRYLANYALLGRLGNKDPEQAEKLYFRAAELKDIAGMCMTGRNYLRKGDIRKAVEMLTEAAFSKIEYAGDETYAGLAVQELISLRLPEDGRPDETTHDTYCLVLRYVQLHMNTLNSRIRRRYKKDLAEDYVIRPEHLPLAKAGDEAAMQLITGALGDSGSAIQRADILERIRWLQEKVKEKKDPKRYVLLYRLYALDPRTYRDARAWLEKAMEEKHADAFLSVWYDSYGIFNYDYRTRYDYLLKAASLGDGAAKLELECIEYSREEEERKARQRREMRERAEEAVRQEKRARRELLERDVDIMLGGSGHSMEEKWIAGKISTYDYDLYEETVGK